MLTMSETFGLRVRRLRERREMTPKDLAALTGIAYSTLKDIENERQHGTTRLPHLVKALRTNTKYLETGKGDPDVLESAEPEPGVWDDILAYGQAVGLGKGAEAQEYAESHKLKFRADSLSKKRLRPAALAVMYGDGDSMLPRIHKGDAILFDTTDLTPRDGGIYVVQWKGEVYAKRAEIIDETVYFRADNPHGDHNWIKPKRMDAKRDPIQILGRVRWIGSWED